MKYQRTPLPPDVDYFIDCANELDEINSFCHAVLTMLGDRKTVMAIVDMEHVGRRPLRARNAICFALDAYAHELVAALPLHEQKAFAAVGMRWEPLSMLRIAEYLVHFNFEDETRGGASLPFRRIWRCDRNYDPTPRTRRRLYAPAAIRRYTKLEDCSIPRARHLAAGLRRLPVALPADIELVTALAQEQREAYRFEYFAAKSQFEAGLRSKYRSISSIHRPQRKVIRRAAEFCSSLIGSDQVSAFARGQAVTLPGREICLEVACNQSLATVGHGALAVRLCTLDGVRLAQVCVYFHDTPALDQLAAVAMHVGAGEEAAIIETGNLFNITNAGMQHPVVQARMAKKITPELQALVDRIERHGVSDSMYDQQRAAMRRYKADTIQIYLDAVKTQVWGRDAVRLAPFTDDLMEAALGDIQENAREAA